jgi:hypothetical protein
VRLAITHIFERVGPEVITILDDALSGSFTFRKQGTLRQLVWASSDYASAATFVITILNAAGDTIYTSAALAHNSGATIVSLATIFADEIHTVTATTGDPGVGGATITITLLVER